MKKYLVIWLLIIALLGMSACKPISLDDFTSGTGRNSSAAQENQSKAVSKPESRVESKAESKEESRPESKPESQEESVPQESSASVIPPQESSAAAPGGSDDIQLPEPQTTGEFVSDFDVRSLNTRSLGHYSFKVPAQWNELAQSNSYSYSQEDQGIVAGQIVIQTISTPGIENEPNWEFNFIGGFMGSFSDSVLKGGTQFKVNGMEAFLFVIEGTNAAGIRIHIYTTVMEENGELLALTLTEMGDGYVSHLPDYMHILYSITCSGTISRKAEKLDFASQSDLGADSLLQSRTLDYNEFARTQYKMDHYCWYYPTDWKLVSSDQDVLNFMMCDQGDTALLQRIGLTELDLYTMTDGWQSDYITSFMGAFESPELLWAHVLDIGGDVYEFAFKTTFSDVETIVIVDFYVRGTAIYDSAFLNYSLTDDLHMMDYYHMVYSMEELKE